ncbi:hypothetical protein NDU88_005717 [Pleurodeles waltl]|uniref:Uncharacterized protein n=1 Tax=Pleurodeles waltl TaxID=8319 RepID=A0AAV7MA68_PLEWA|nr:hypothetical protein NDU88_005717 [Pleurodeles waltl]
MRKRKNSDGCHMEEKKIEAWSFIELINFIEYLVKEDVFSFKLSELRHKYEDCLVALGVQEIYKVCFKEKILGYFPQGQVQNYGKHVVLIHD